MPAATGSTSTREVEMAEVVGRERPELRKRGTAGSLTSMSEYPDLDFPLDEYMRPYVYTKDEREAWIMRLVLVALVDCGLSFMIAGVALTTAWYDSGLTLYCLGIQALNHMMSSILTIMRFWRESRFGKNGDKDGRPEDKSGGDSSSNSAVTTTTNPAELEMEDAGLLRDRKYDFVREQNFTAAGGCLLLLASCTLLIKAANKFKKWEHWHESIESRQKSEGIIQSVCEVLAWKAGIVYLIQAVIRGFARRDSQGNKFTNHIFWISVTSSAFSVVLAISASYQKEWSWKAEPIAASIMALGCLYEGMRILYIYVDDADDLLTRHEKP